MTEQRTATNQFSRVVDALQLGEKTGILTVEREEGGILKVGMITFVKGHAVDATLGSYQGRDAATKLFAWRACRFSFVPMLPEQITSSPGIYPAPVEPAQAGPGDRDLADEFHSANPGMQDNLNRRPFPTIEALESMNTVLSILDRQGFTRTHRRLFLLIDGKRSIEELALLVSRTPDEIMPLLANLEQAGFIQL